MESAKTLPKTHWKKLYNPNYFGAWSIEEGQDLILRIKSINLESITGSDGKSEECTVIRWVEKEKPMILNKTNARTITKVLSSPYIEDWEGKSIQLYVDKVKAFGDIVDAVRVRPKLPKLEKETLSPEHPAWSKAQAAMYAKNTTVAAIRTKYKLSNEHAKMLEDAQVA